MIVEKQQCAQRAARMDGTVVTCREEASEVGMYVTCFCMMVGQCQHLEPTMGRKERKSIAEQIVKV